MMTVTGGTGDDPDTRRGAEDRLEPRAHCGVAVDDGDADH
jgi:hypothetical protein